MKTLITTQQFLYSALIFTTFLPLVGASGEQEIPYPSPEEIAAIEKESAQDPNGNSPLMLAIAKKDMRLANYFIKHHPEQIKKTNNASQFPLQMAAFYNSWPIAKLLVDNGADVNQTTQKHPPYISYDTALIEASIRNNHELMEYLIRHGAKANHKTGEGQNALDLALFNRLAAPNLQTVRILQSAGININEYGKNATPLLFAIFLHAHKALEVLIEAGADLNIPYKNDEDELFSPFAYALGYAQPQDRGNKTQNIQAAHMLMNAGADIYDSKNKNSSLTFLVQAIIKSHKKLDKNAEKLGLEIFHHMLNSGKLSQEALSESLWEATYYHYIPAVEPLLLVGATLAHPNPELDEVIKNVKEGIAKNKEIVLIMKEFFTEETSVPKVLHSIVEEYMVGPKQKKSEEKDKKEAAASTKK